MQFMLEVTVCGRLGFVVFTENIFNTLIGLIKQQF